jgi:hypothetical protein
MSESAIIKRIIDAVANIGKGQICIEPTANATTGIKSLAWKDADGNAYTAVAVGHVPGTSDPTEGGTKFYNISTEAYEVPVVGQVYKAGGKYPATALLQKFTGTMAAALLTTIDTPGGTLSKAYDSWGGVDIGGGTVLPLGYSDSTNRITPVYVRNSGADLAMAHDNVYSGDTYEVWAVYE